EARRRYSSTGAAGERAAKLAGKAPDQLQEAVEQAVLDEHLGRLARTPLVHPPQRGSLARVLVHLDEDLLIARERQRQVLVDLGGEGIDRGTADGDRREHVGHLLVQ